MPRAASTMSGSTWRNAVQVLIRIGGSASSVSANSEGTNPVPSMGITSASTASDGSVRPMFAAVIAASAARRLSASSTPSGNAIGDGEAERRRRQRDVSVQRAEEPVGMGDDELPGFDEQHGGRPSGPTPQPALDRREAQVRGDRKRARRQRADPDLGREVVADAAEDQRSQAAGVDVGRDDGDADHGNRGDPESGHDHGQRQRQLDAGQDLAAAHAHAACRVDHFGGNFAHAGGDIADHDHQRERDHADDRIGLAQAHDRDQQREERERGNRVQKAADGEGPAERAVAARRPDADGERQREGDGQRRERDDDVLAERRPAPGPSCCAAISSLRGGRPRETRRPRCRQRWPRCRAPAGDRRRAWARVRALPHARAACRCPDPATRARADRRLARRRAARLPPAGATARPVAPALATACAAIDAWSSTISDTGTTSSDAGLARWRMAPYKATSVFCIVAKPECSGPCVVSCSGNSESAGENSFWQRWTQSIAVCASAMPSVSNATDNPAM